MALVRSNLLAVLGYSVVLLVGGVVLGVFGSAASLIAGPQQPQGSPLAGLVAVEPTTGVLVVSGAVYVLVVGAFGALYATYSVAFYESISEPAEPEPR